MDLTRRDLLTGAGALVAAKALSTTSPMVSNQLDPLPAKADFAIPAGQTYLNSAFIHPMPIVSADAVRRYLDTRTLREERKRSGDSLAAEVKEEFARLINARPQEISLVQNTSSAENLIVNGMGIPDGKSNVVTDALHFDGSLVLYGELAKRGLDLRIARPTDWRIRLEDLDRAIDRNTRLVAVSLVSWINGFQHDLKAIADLAHSRGAYLYADIVQAAGNTPIDVRASGVDFCACSSFKWLMGDFGLGFLYIKEELLDRVVRRTQVGYQQAETEMHYLASDPPADTPITWSLHTDASGHFEVGTYSQAAVNALSQSIPYLRRIGPDKIQAHRQPLLRKLHQELPRLGFTAITPADSPSALISFTMSGAEKRFAERLKQARVSVSLYGDRMRISPSLFNDMKDIETLLAALS